MAEQAVSPQRFIVTTPGLSATRWLSFALASHPDVFVAHGKHPLDSVMRGSFTREKTIGDIESLTLGNRMSRFYERMNLEDVFAVYRSIKPEAKAYGNVHAYTIDVLMHHVTNEDDLARVNILNVLRHPVTYVASHFSLVRSAEQHPELYWHYAEVMFPRALQQYPELFLLECSDYPAFLAFAVSCLSVANLARDFAYPQFQHRQMEALTTQVESLQVFCESLTELAYSTSKLDALIQQGPINQHRKTSNSIRAGDVYTAWAAWQQDMAQMMIPATILDKFSEVGYDVSMLRGETPTTNVPRRDDHIPCLADHLRLLDEYHPLLAFLYPQNEQETLLIDTDYYGYNLVRHKGRYYALAQSLGPVNWNEVDEQTLSQYQTHGDCLIAPSFDELKHQLDQPTPTLVETGYQGFNLVQYRRQFYALSLALGPVDLPHLDEHTLREYQANGHCFIGRSLDEVKQQTDVLVRQALQQELARRTDERETLQQELARRTDERETLQQELARHTDERETLQQELARRTDERETLRHELSHLKATRWFKVMNRINRLRGK